jgi:hypothetical protein
MIGAWLSKAVISNGETQPAVKANQGMQIAWRRKARIKAPFSMICLMFLSC